MPYYVRHFSTALRWLRECYEDLLTDQEIGFITRFAQLPGVAQALLVRLIMRKGEHFRADKLHYPEIGSIADACLPLLELQWIDARPLVSIEELSRLLTRAELLHAFGMRPANLRKSAACAQLRERHPHSRHIEDWVGPSVGTLYRVQAAPRCTQLRLLFFGNFRQEWSEFVLADLGVFRYEAVPLCRRSRAFHCRQDIDDFFLLYECRRRLHDEQPVDQVLADLPRTPLRHEWLEGRRAKLLFQVARRLETAGERARALALYRDSRHPEAKLRMIRALELDGRHDDALDTARRALRSPSGPAEAQRAMRAMRRLERRLGRPLPPRRAAPAAPRLDLLLQAPQDGARVETLALEHVAAPGAPVYYVENALINSLFGLLCWEAIFAPVSGAFFHPFQAGPMDLSSPDFRSRRAPLFERCLRRLESQEYGAVIRERFRTKQGIQSAFVAWDVLNPDLLEAALACIPAAHLRCFFERLLDHLPENRNGLPDLVQFWLHDKRYRLIEVKGPGDRLQDNQRRWIDYCLHHGLPVAVCHVRFAEAA